MFPFAGVGEPRCFNTGPARNSLLVAVARWWCASTERRNPTPSQHGVPGAEIGDYPWRLAKKSRRSAGRRSGDQSSSQRSRVAAGERRPRKCGAAGAVSRAGAESRCARRSSQPLCSRSGGVAVRAGEFVDSSATAAMGPCRPDPWHRPSYASAMSFGDGARRTRGTAPGSGPIGGYSNASSPAAGHNFSAKCDRARNWRQPGGECFLAARLPSFVVQFWEIVASASVKASG
jgi:hypothetical protein